MTMPAKLGRLPAWRIEELLATPYGEIRQAWGNLIAKMLANGNTMADAVRVLGLSDRFYLLTVLLKRRDAFNPWLYDRCREVERKPDYHLDLWAREHYKSTIITYAGGIQEILNDPGITIGIFSHTKPTSKKFLAQIKFEFESNKDLVAIYSDILWENPKRDAPAWSEDKGIIVKRETNPKECTVEAHGLVDGQPTSAHFSLRIYDDVVTIDSVSTPEQVQKTSTAYHLSGNLGARGPDGFKRYWMVGTRYSHADTYQELIDRKSITPRIYAATDDGGFDGNPVFLSTAAWIKLKEETPRPIIAAQQLQNPMAGATLLFRKEWLQFSSIRPTTLNVYLLCDPAGSRKKDSDRTAMVVLGVDAQWNLWLLDGYCHRMSLAERWELLLSLRIIWSNMPGVQVFKAGYEKYGMQSDIEHFELEMERRKDIWEIVELNWPREGPGAKYDRIQRLEPMFRNRRFWISMVTQGETKEQAMVRKAGQAFRVFYPVRHKDESGELYSFNKRFIEEYLSWPFGARKDFLDGTSRIFDIEATAPVIIDEGALQPEEFVDGI